MAPSTFRLHFGDQVIEKSAWNLREALITALADRIRCGLAEHVFKAERKNLLTGLWSQVDLPAHISFNHC